MAVFYDAIDWVAPERNPDDPFFVVSDLGTPDGQIRSTYPIESGAYATISGTSMSSPHVAGRVALLLETRPDTQAHDVRNLLQNHADPSPWSLNPAAGLLDSVHRQGRHRSEATVAAGQRSGVMTTMSADSAWSRLGGPPGLCQGCAHAVLNETRRGTAYLRCGRATWDDRMVRHPRLPVLACAGYEPADPGRETMSAGP